MCGELWDKETFRPSPVRKRFLILSTWKRILVPEEMTWCVPPQLLFPLWEIYISRSSPWLQRSHTTFSFPCRSRTMPGGVGSWEPVRTSTCHTEGPKTPCLWPMTTSNQEWQILRSWSSLETMYSLGVLPWPKGGFIYKGQRGIALQESKEKQSHINGMLSVWGLTNRYRSPCSWKLRAKFHQRFLTDEDHGK